MGSNILRECGRDESRPYKNDRYCTITCMKLAAFLRDLLLEAGDRLRKHYGRVKSIHYKAGSVINLVTNVDQDVERFIKLQIRKNYPEDSILAEESEIEKADSPQRWIIDPLDGTTNFAHGLSLFCVSIGVERHGELIAGGVYDPIHDELFFAVRGKGATLNRKRIGVSKTSKLERALIVTGFPYDIHEHPEKSLPYFNAMIQRAQGLRRLGSAALDICYLAMSRFDGFFEVFLHPWDTAAGCLILQEAGGKITDFNGETFSIYKRQLVASNGLIHDEMIEVLKTTQKRSHK
jgi:myo-inositol-1(or 4)-monophosphatase